MNDNGNKLAENLRNIGKQFSATFESVLNDLQPFFEYISREYSVNQVEFKKSSNRLMEKGYFLPLTSTPRDYIRMDAECSGGEELKEYYINYLENKNIIIDLIKAFSSEEMSTEWRAPIKKSYKIIEKYGIDDTYSLILPFYYSFFEFLVRDKIENRGKDLWGMGSIVERTKQNIWSDKNLDENTKRYFTEIMDEFHHYFYENFKKPNDVSRNSALHGYSTPVNWGKVDFYKLVSGISLLIYILV